MTDARIYQPTKTAMQSGRAGAQKWVLEFESRGAKFTDPLMGWVGSSDTRGQVRIKFDTLDGAESFARKSGLTYRVQTPEIRRFRKKNYADNFGYKAVG